MRRILILVSALAAASVLAAKPDTPTNVSPQQWSRPNVTLQGSPFSDPDPGDSQGGAFFELRAASGSYGDSVALDSGVIAPARSWSAPGSFADGDQRCFHLRYLDDAGNPSDFSSETCFTVDAVPPTQPGVPTVTTLGGGRIQIDFAESTDLRSGLGAFVPSYEYEDGGLYLPNVTGGPASPVFDEVGPGTWRVQILPIDNAVNFGPASPSSAPFTIAADLSLPVPAAPTFQFCPVNDRQNYLQIAPIQPGDTFVVQWAEADAGVWHYQFHVGGSYGFYWHGAEGWATARVALIRDGGTSDWSPPAPPCAIDFTAPTAPTPINVEPLGDTVSLTWGAADDALAGVDAYLVERSAFPAGSYATVVTTAALAATDAPGPGRWVYRVRARDKADNVGAASAEVGVLVSDVDAGVIGGDAGASADGGPSADGGASADGGEDVGDGGVARSHVLVGCGCAGSGGGWESGLFALLTLMTLAMTRPRRAVRR